MNFMKVIAWGVLLMLSLTTMAEDEYLIVKGRILSQAHIPDVHPSGCFKDGVLCMNVYYRFEIVVNDSLNGGAPTNITGAQYLHGNYYRGSEDYLFVLEPIVDEKSKRLLGADYFIKERVAKNSEYCLRKNFSEYFEKSTELEDLNHNCISMEDTFEGLKLNLLYEVIDRVEDSLEKDGVLIDLEIFALDKHGKLYSWDNEPHGACSEEDRNSFDLDRLELCDSFFSSKEVVELKVKQGLSTKVTMMIKNELARLPFDNIKSDFVIDNTKSADVVHWYFEVE